MTLNRIEAEEDNRSMRYDTIVEFNVDSKAEFDQAHETKTKNAVPVLDSLTNTEVDWLFWVLFDLSLSLWDFE